MCPRVPSRAVPPAAQADARVEASKPSPPRALHTPAPAAVARLEGGGAVADDGGAAGCASDDGGAPSAKRARKDAATSPAKSVKPEPAAETPKPAPPQATGEAPQRASRPPTGAKQQLAGASAQPAPAARVPTPLATPPPAVTAQLMRNGVVIATEYDVVRCLALAKNGDVVHATGVHDGACLVLRVPNVLLRGWPAGAPTPAADAPKAFTAYRRNSGTAVELAAPGCGLEGITMRAPNALVVLKGVTDVTVRGCALQAGPDRNTVVGGVGCLLQPAASARVEDSTVTGFAVAGVVVCLGAALQARRVRIKTGGFGLRLDGSASCSVLDCVANGSGPGVMKCAFYINSAPSDISGCEAHNCGEGFRAEFPSTHRDPAAEKPARANLRPLVEAFDSLRTVAHKAHGIKCSDLSSHGILLLEGVGMDLTDAVLESCGGSGVRMCEGPDGFNAPITMRLKKLRGCAEGGVAFEASQDGTDTFDAGRMEPLTEHALLASGCDMGDNAGGNFVRYATATL